MNELSKTQEAALAVLPEIPTRELTVPAGMLVVGKIHKHSHFLVVLSGRLGWIPAR